MTTIYDDCSKEELLQIVSEMQKDLNDSKKEIERLHKVFDIKDDARCELVKENKELQRIINDLQTELAGATNDYNQANNEYKLASYEISVLNKYIDKLTAENNDLRLKRKMFVKNILNQLYGSCYADTDSIKSERKEKTNDIDN